MANASRAECFNPSLNQDAGPAFFYTWIIYEQISFIIIIITMIYNNGSENN